MEEELGDILLQVVFHAQLAREKGRFSIDDVVKQLVGLSSDPLPATCTFTNGSKPARAADIICPLGECLLGGAAGPADGGRHGAASR